MVIFFFFECERAMQTYIEPTQSYVTFITKTEAYYKKHIFGITLDDVRNLAINPVWLSCCCCVSELVVVVAVVVVKAEALVSPLSIVIGGGGGPL